MSFNIANESAHTILFQVLTFAYQTMMSHLHCLLVLKSFKVPSKLLLELFF